MTTKQVPVPASRKFQYKSVCFPQTWLKINCKNGTFPINAKSNRGINTKTIILETLLICSDLGLLREVGRVDGPPLQVLVVQVGPEDVRAHVVPNTVDISRRRPRNIHLLSVISFFN